MKTLVTILVLALLAWGGWVLFGGEDGDTAPTVYNTPAQTYNTPQTATTTGSSSTSTPNTSAPLKTFTVNGQNFSFSPATMTVNRGDRVRVTFNNTSGTHDWVIDQFNARTGILQAGQSQTIEFIANQSGSFEYYCSVGNHRQMGMKGTLTVN